VNGFGYVVVRANSHCLHGAVNRSLCGDNNHGDSLAITGNSLEQFKAGEAWHFQISNYDGRGPRHYLFITVLAVTRGLGSISPRGDQFGESCALVFFVLYDQYFFITHDKPSLFRDALSAARGQPPESALI